MLKRPFKSITRLVIVALVLLLAISVSPAVVAQDAPLATERSIAQDFVRAGDPVVVKVLVLGYDAEVMVVETLPTGFLYRSSSLPETTVNKETNTLTFILRGEQEFIYVLIAGLPGTHTFAGTITSPGTTVMPIMGQDSVVVSPSPYATTARSFERGFVDLQGDIEITVDLFNYGWVAQITEIIPIGFTYVRSSLPEGSVSVSKQQIEFVILGEERFTYIVTAPEQAGTYTFIGTISDFNRTVTGIGGSTSLLVGHPGITQTDSGIRSVNENTPTGISIGVPIAALSPVGILTFKLGGDDGDSFDISSGGQLVTKAPLDFEIRYSYTFPVTFMDEYGASGSFEMTVLVNDVDEDILQVEAPPREESAPKPTPSPAPTPTVIPTPIADPTPTVDPTPTAAPTPTVTPIALQPTVTSLSQTPEATTGSPVPGTAIPTLEKSDGGGISPLLLGFLIVLVVGGVGLFVAYKRGVLPIGKASSLPVDGSDAPPDGPNVPPEE